MITVDEQRRHAQLAVRQRRRDGRRPRQALPDEAVPRRRPAVEWIELRGRDPRDGGSELRGAARGGGGGWGRGNAAAGPVGSRVEGLIGRLRPAGLLVQGGRD